MAAAGKPQWIVGLILAVWITEGWTVGIRPQVNIPTRIPGVSLSQADRSAKVVIDFYLDLNCPDSAKAFPVLQQLSREYSPEDLAVFIQLMVLPYHRNAYLLTEGYLQVVDKAHERVQDYVALCFNNIATFQGSTNRNKSETDMIRLLGNLQAEVTGISSQEFVQDYTGYDSLARTFWKYGVRKGVAGTPWFFINDVDSGAGSSDFLDIDTWKKTVNSLLGHSTKRTAADIQSRSVKQDSQRDVKTEAAASEIRIAADTEAASPPGGAAAQLSSYLRQIKNKQYKHIHSKYSIKNPRKVSIMD